MNLRQFWPIVPEYDRDIVNQFDPWQFATYLDVRAQAREARIIAVASILIIALSVLLVLAILLV